MNRPALKDQRREAKTESIESSDLVSNNPRFRSNA